MAGSLLGWTLEKAPLESLTLGDWVRSLSWATVAILAPIVGAVVLARGGGVPRFVHVIGRPPDRLPLGVEFVFGALLVLLTVLAVEAALGLSFDPRYRDFPFTALSAAIVPFLVSTKWRLSLPRRRSSAETVAATTLALAAIYIFLNETVQNWQAAWFCTALLGLAFILAQVRDEPG